MGESGVEWRGKAAKGDIRTKERGVKGAGKLKLV
jgi:hypothetical protein